MEPVGPFRAFPEGEEDHQESPQAAAVDHLETHPGAGAVREVHPFQVDQEGVVDQEDHQFQVDQEGVVDQEDHQIQVAQEGVVDLEDHSFQVGKAEAVDHQCLVDQEGEEDQVARQRKEHRGVEEAEGEQRYQVAQEGAGVPVGDQYRTVLARLVAAEGEEEQVDQNKGH